MITGHWLLIQIRVEQGRQLGPRHRITSRHDNTYIKLAKGGNQCAEFGLALEGNYLPLDDHNKEANTQKIAPALN